MNDSGLLKDVLEKFSNQASLLYTLLGFVSVNIIVGVINLIAQIRLKKLDVDVHKKNIRETRRLDLMQELYKKLDEIRNIYNDNVLLQSKLQDANSYINSNELYLGKKELEIARNFCDYSSTLLVSYTRKDIAKETRFLESFKNEFNK